MLLLLHDVNMTVNRLFLSLLGENCNWLVEKIDALMMKTDKMDV